MKATLALGIVGLCLAGTLALGLWGVRRVRMDPQQLVVGGRSFGTLFLWLLLAGEIYTSFTFLGAAGWAYARGAPAFYIIAYGAVAYVLSYFLLPPVWRLASRHRLLTSPDYFVVRYGSPNLGTLVALVSLVFTVPYATLQLTGIQVLLTMASYGGLNPTAAVGVAFGLVVAFVFLSGLRGVAWASLVKDALVLGGVVFAGVVLPVRFFGSPAGVVDRVLAAHPGWMTLSPDLSNRGVPWFVSTVLLTAAGFFMWPQALAAVYSARDEATIQRNAILLPFYQLMILLVYFAGWTALLVVPGLTGPEADRSFVLVVQRFYPPWVLGSVAAAGCLAGLVPASVQILAAASIVSKNLLADRLRVVRDEAGQTRATRVLVLVVAGAAFLFWAEYKSTLVGLLLIAYNGITQLFPGVALSLRRRPPAAVSVGAGILAGVGALVAAAAAHVEVVAGLNVGLAALAANGLTLAVTEAVVRRLGGKPRAPAPAPAPSPAPTPPPPTAG